jgi:hypothetical protein
MHPHLNGWRRSTGSTRSRRSSSPPGCWAKFWIFTLSALAAIGDADLGQPGATISFVLFVVLAESIHLALIGISFAMPSKSEVVLDSTSQWLSSHNRTIMIVFGSVFGTWFMVKALNGFGVI